MQYSHSRIECHNGCPYKYKIRYVDKLKTIPDYSADNALICGNTIHLGAEKDLKAALEFYKSNYYIFTDRHIEEIMKFEYLIPKIHELLDGVNVYKKEFKINTSRFIGIVDLITKNDDGTVDVFDYKYSNNYEKYINSPQLHIYKYFLEQIGFKVRKLGFIFIPKVSIKQKQTESTYQFRCRLMEDIQASKIKIAEVQYDATKLIDFMDDIIKINEDKDYKKIPTRLCDWCDYKKLCLEEDDVDMQLPNNKRREIGKVNKRVMWIYGAPFCGKTTFANDFPDPLMLNTDGNIKFVDAPYIAIKDAVKVEGRITNRTFAWQIFKDTIEELEKKQNDFKTIVVDLLEDTYEYCRLFMYDKLGIEHESDDSFRAWDKVRTEFLSTLKRLLNLDYENIILISHVDTSKDITKKAGDRITKIAPNLNEKCANKVAGMVDIVARVIAEDTEHTLNFKTSEVIFGGGRLHVKTEKIPLDLNELLKVYDEANKGKKDVASKEEEKPAGRRSRKSEEVKDETPVNNSVEDTKNDQVNETADTELKEEKQTRRRHNTDNVEKVDAEITGVDEKPNEIKDAEPVSEDKPSEDAKPRRRRSRKE